jgi:tRNA(adenine34) deaminase
MQNTLGDDHYMRIAMQEALRAYDQGEVPVGAIIVAQDRIIAKGMNSVEMLTDVTAHAEIIALTAASQYLGSKYLPECTLYVTLEPCPMCAGALRWSQIARVVYGASDDKSGFMRFGKELLHPVTLLEFGVMHDECADLMRSFFAERRKQKTEG